MHVNSTVKQILVALVLIFSPYIILTALLMLFLIITAKLLKLSNESSLDQHHIRVSILGKHKHTGDAYIIWIHEGLYFGEGLPGYSLVNPN